MGAANQLPVDAFVTFDASEGPVPASASDFEQLSRRPAKLAEVSAPPPAAGVSVAVFHGFDLLDGPLVKGVDALPGQVLRARTAVALRTDMIGSQVVLAFENADPERPIILGVLQPPQVAQAAATRAPASINAQVDGERVVIAAEREIVLQCGDASITLTRAGKVIIQGNHILSRSTGYNRIKGAAIDIN